MTTTIGEARRIGILTGSEVETIAAAGSTQSDATQIDSAVAVVSGADGTKGVKLPTARKGLQVSVYSSTATNGLKVYPAVDDDINDGTTDAAITIEGKTRADFLAVDDTTWAAIFTANS